MSTADDERYMRTAIELAKNGLGHTDPNPLVGAVIVKGGRIIGQGWHARIGGLHAERSALKNCAEDPEGAAIYVTLEPCCHYGKQPPCTLALIEAKIAKVVIGSRDPNPLVSGRGVKQLEEAGIEVVRDFLKDECDALNERFFYFITKKRPFTTLKFAMTADGKTACANGRSQWITGPAARERVHRDRAKNVAIMTGIGTVLADDPELTSRIPGGIDPIRIVCDSNLRIPLDSNLVRTAGGPKAAEHEFGACLPTPGTDPIQAHETRWPRTIVACTEGALGRNPEKAEKLKEAGVMILPAATDQEGHLDLQDLMAKLGERDIDSVYLEAGNTLAWAALAAGAVNRIHAYIAPKILGGTGAYTPVGGPGLPDPNHPFRLEDLETEKIGDDLLVTAKVCREEGGGA